MVKKPDISSILAVIQSGNKSVDELTNLFQNVSKSDALSEMQREDVVEEIEKTVRLINSSKANKLFGPKNRVTKQKLQSFHERLRSKYDLSGNRHKNGVKLGGNVMRGEAHIYDYLSYKNADNLVCHISFFQKNIESETIIRVWCCDVSEQSDVSKRIEFDENKFDEAKILYEGHLKAVLQLNFCD